MSLIDRYIHEVGRHLPRKNRTDIQAELRSSVVDSLEDRFGPEPTEDEMTGFLKDFGRPRKVAASYFPEGQYLIGPRLYPLFQMIAWIVVAAVLGAQLLAWGVGIFIAGESYSILGILGSLMNSVPVSLGWLVITFMILQRFDVRPDTDDETWDPQTLPQINDEENLKRGELIVGLVFSIIILVLVFFFPQWIGFVTTPGGKFYPNPVIIQYLGWIKVSLIVGITLDIFLLWKGRWGTATRFAKIAVNMISIAVLALLIQGHNAWLAARGASGLFYTIETISGIADGVWEVVGMHAFRLAFGVALIVTIIETLKSIYRLVRSRFQKELSVKVLAPASE
ncbi:MAG: hypothetical protein WBB69_14720 [Anaerolineales bacterium]